MRRTKELQKVLDAAGGVSAVARLMGISRQAVSKWVKVPKRRVEALLAAKNDTLTRDRPKNA